MRQYEIDAYQGELNMRRAKAKYIIRTITRYGDPILAPFSDMAHLQDEQDAIGRIKQLLINGGVEVDDMPEDTTYRELQIRGE